MTNAFQSGAVVEEAVCGRRPGSPAAINHFIGQQPMLAFGSSDNDPQTLEWTIASAGARLGRLAHHTDTRRKWVAQSQG